jgi:hypothetical protein
MCTVCEVSRVNWTYYMYCFNMLQDENATPLLQLVDERIAGCEAALFQQGCEYLAVAADSQFTLVVCILGTLT